jgi:hypothetical protein
LAAGFLAGAFFAAVFLIAMSDTSTRVELPFA